MCWSSTWFNYLITMNRYYFFTFSSFYWSFALIFSQIIGGLVNDCHEMANGNKFSCFEVARHLVRCHQKMASDIELVITVDNDSRLGTLSLESNSRLGTLSLESNSRLGTLSLESDSRLGTLSLENDKRLENVVVRERQTAWNAVIIEWQAATCYPYQLRYKYPNW